MLIQFVVDGQPVGKGRPKFARQGQFVRTYTPDNTVIYENAVKLAYKAVAGREAGFMAGVPISAIIRLYYKIPGSTSKKRKQMMLDGEIRPCVKPDIDNVAKCILDALNGIAFSDDNQIVFLAVSKFYDEYPRAEVSLSST